MTVFAYFIALIYAAGKSPDAAMRIQRHPGEHPAEPVRAFRNRGRVVGRSHSTRHQGDYTI